MKTELQEITARVRAAANDATPLRIRGGGSKDFYGQSLEGEWLDTRGLAGILSYEPSELVVTAAAGTPLRELEATLAASGQALPFEPPHFGTAATVGGMVAAGLSGPARASVGALRDHVLGAVLLNGRAERLTFGGQVMKNVAGYDISRLLAGSLGTLGLILEVSLKVLPQAPAEATLRFELDQASALAQLRQWSGQPLPLNASRWVQDQGQALLFVRLRGAQAAVRAACLRMGGEHMDGTTAASDWQACREQTLDFFRPAPGLALWRLSVPAAAAPLPVHAGQMIEWHGGLRWLWESAGAAEQVRALAAAAGGQATLWRAADPQDKAVGVFSPLAPPVLAIHRALKAQFDPMGIFNRGRLYPHF